MMGEWGGRLGATHSAGVVMLSLTADGHTISGTACYTEDGYLIFRNTPVHGSGRTISFTVPADSPLPCCANAVGTTMTATFQGDGQWHGSVVWGGYGSSTEIVFSSGGDQCRGAVLPPVPTALSGGSRLP